MNNFGCPYTFFIFSSRARRKIGHTHSVNDMMGRANGSPETLSKLALSSGHSPVVFLKATHSCSHKRKLTNLAGLGQLSTPYALENGGWSSAFLLVGLGIVCAYTSHLLGKCLDRSPKSRSYTDIGQEAYGSKGRVIAATFVYLEIFMALVSYTISLHDNLSIVFSGTQISARWAHMSSSQLLTVIAVLIALPSLWLRNLSSISFLSSGGILMSIIIFASVALTAIFGGVRSDHEIPVLRIRNIPGISGLYVFGYAGHIVFPDLYKSMRDPSKFTKVCFSCL